MSIQTAIANPTTLQPGNINWMEVPANGQCVFTLAPKETLFHDGDEADFVYEVIDGLIASHSLLCDGRRQIMGFYHPGDIIGMSHDGNHHTSCSAVGSTRVRSIPRSMLLNAAKDRPELSEKLLNCMTNQLYGMQSHFVVLGRKCAQEKLASFILALARRYAAEDAESVTFRLQMTRMDIADYLGMTIETVSRTLTKLKTSGVIEMPDTLTVCVPDLFKLEDVAEHDDEGW